MATEDLLPSPERIDAELVRQREDVARREAQQEERRDRNALLIESFVTRAGA